MIHWGWLIAAFYLGAILTVIGIAFFHGATQCQDEETPLGVESAHPEVKHERI